MAKAKFDCVLVVAHIDYLDTTTECLESLLATELEQPVFVLVNGITSNGLAYDSPFWELFARFNDPSKVYICPTAFPELGYELGALKSFLWAIKTSAAHMGYQPYRRVLLLQDTFIIHSREFFDRMFGPEGSTSLNNVYQSYCMVYDIGTLLAMDIPDVRTKEDAVRYEGEFNKAYAARVGEVTAIWPDLRESTHTAEKWGRVNRLKTVPGVFTKYKGCWHTSMIKDAR